MKVVITAVMAEEKWSANEREDYTEDGTVDLRGRPVSRSKTGTWRACYFILAYEVFERLAYFGIAGNLVLYLTKKLHQGTVKSATSVTNWSGTVWVTPLAGAYIADAYLSRYWTFLIAALIYLLVLIIRAHHLFVCMLTLTVSLRAMRPPPCRDGVVGTQGCQKATWYQVGMFFLALYTIAIGAGGTKPNISTMGADQFDDFEPKEKAQKLSFFNWWMFCLFFGVLFSSTFLVYVQDNVGFALGYGLPTLGLAFSIFVFLLGTPFYRHKRPMGSPITRMLQVLVASLRKWNVRVPHDPKELHELTNEDYSQKQRPKIDHTSSLRFLDKAATKKGETSPWMLCTVTQVEETKQMVKMVPILIATFVPSIIAAESNTLFIRQGSTLDRSIGSHFQIPPASLIAFVTIFMMISIALYDIVFIPTVRRYTNNPRGITLLQKLGVGLVIHVVIMVTACLAERKRLSVARENQILNEKEKIPLTIFILLPQFALVGIADAFVEVAKIEFFYDQAPQGMKSLGTAYFTTSNGIGYFLSSFVLSTVADITKRNGQHKGWILDNLNISRLDYYYAFLAVLCFLNLVFFLIVSKLFVYNVDVTQPKTGFAEP